MGRPDMDKLNIAGCYGDNTEVYTSKGWIPFEYAVASDKTKYACILDNGIKFCVADNTVDDLYGGDFFYVPVGDNILKLTRGHHLWGRDIDTPPKEDDFNNDGYRFISTDELIEKHEVIYVLCGYMGEDYNSYTFIEQCVFVNQIRIVRAKSLEHIYCAIVPGHRLYVRRFGKNGIWSGN